MAKTVRVRYVGGFDQVSLPTVGGVVERGGVLEVSAAVAGRAPGWRTRRSSDLHWWETRDTDGEVHTFDPGEGLLAQPGNWQLALDDVADSTQQEG
jgi:hypothetical protein